jgi:signal transduction histidine kinase
MPLDNPVSPETSPPRDAANDGDGPTSASLHAESLNSATLVAAALAQGIDAHAVASPDGTLVFINAAMLEAAGLDQRAPHPSDIFTLIEAFRAAGFADPAAELGAALRAGRVFECEVACRERGRVFVLRVAPITRQTPPPAEAATLRHGEAAGSGEATRAEQLLGLAFVARDVTRLREAERLRGAMLSLVSHELRTPLTSISGFAELLAEDETLPAETREFISIIMGESQRLTRMVNAFLTGARGGQSEEEGDLRLSPLSLDEVAREAAEGLRRAALDRDVRLVYEDSPRLPPVVADGLVIERAVATLLSDALARCAAGGSITVSTSHETEAVLLCVETSPAASVASEQAASANDLTLVPDNLALVAEAAERHGGRLLRETRPTGTRLVFTLPRL